jgi:putative heme-binding domain-containing protein
MHRLLIAGVFSIAISSAIADLILPKHREAWNSSRIIGSPNPPPPYRVERAFSSLEFKNPVEMMPEPGRNRFYLIELGGNVFRFENRPDAQAELIGNLKTGLPKFMRLLGFQFHPKFQKNHFVYLVYNDENKMPNGTRLSRFQLTRTEPPQIDYASEEVLLTWVSGGHNGCSLHFGADGYLYISTGDSEVPSPPDPLNTGQDISDLLGSILRIDVDRTENGKPYRVPPDNPFVNHPKARPEVWAYGFRNPWRMSFDRVSGDLWVGDVGWELWEMVYRVVKGGNYGWSITEGPQPVKPNQPQGPTPILKPVVSHSHVEAMSITGGYVYRGKKLPGLSGKWLYGDYVTGKIWGLKYENDRLAWHQELTDSPLRVICFARDHQGEVFIVDYAGQIHALKKNEATDTNRDFPRLLSKTGLFRSVTAQTPSPGVLPYEIEVEPWADGATARRFIGLPGNSKLGTHRRNDFAYGRIRDFWAFPDNTVFAKTLTLETKSGPRKLETQILHRDGENWRPYNYIWNDAQTDAVLSAGNGEEREFELKLGTLKWRSHSSSECMTCHMSRAGIVLGFHHQFTDTDTRINGQKANQLTAWSKLRLFEKEPKPAGFRRLESDLQRHARAYLHVNCAHCHRRGGGGSAPVELRADVPFERVKLAGVTPNQGEFGLRKPDILRPGEPHRSVLLYRIAKSGTGHMPHLGARTIHPKGLQVVRDWILELGGKKATPSPNPAKIAAQQLATTGNSLRLAMQLDETGANLNATEINRLAQTPPHIRGLFERFLPESMRRQTLGLKVNAAEVLSLKGDARNGARLFMEPAGALCINCHQLNGKGREIGPDLQRIGAKYNSAQLLDSILDPSKLIEPAYAAVTVDATDGESYSGFVRERNGGDLVLRDVAGQDHRFTRQQIRKLSPGKLSLMPAGLLQAMTAQEAADLITYLSGLR